MSTGVIAFDNDYSYSYLNNRYLKVYNKMVRYFEQISWRQTYFTD